MNVEEFKRELKRKAQQDEAAYAQLLKDYLQDQEDRKQVEVEVEKLEKLENQVRFSALDILFPYHL